MALYLVRHGETDWNRQQRLQTVSDIPLNARGRAQAACMRDELAVRKIHFVLARSSPLSRAVETAKVILDGDSIPMRGDAAFLELSVGDYEGLYEADLRTAMGAAYDDWRALEHTVAAPGGENIFMAAPRVRCALLGLKSLAIGGDVLIVGHQAVNMTIMAVISGCFDVKNLASRRQRNDEIYVWDMARGHLLDRLHINVAR